MLTKTICISLLFLGFISTPVGAQSLSQNKALVRQFIEIGNSRQMDRLAEVVADNFVRHCQATPDLNINTRDEFRAFMVADAKTFPDSKVTIQQLIAENDRVAIWATYSGTQDGPMGPFPPGGKTMSVDLAGVFRVQDGLIAELWVTWDNVAGLTQLGFFPPAKSDGDGTTE